MEQDVTAKNAETERAALFQREQQLFSLYARLDEIRWKFLSLIGIISMVAIVATSYGEKGFPALVVVAIGFSLSGLVVQIRIFGLLAVLWEGMSQAQRAQDALLPHLSLPRLPLVEERSILRRYILSVGSACCFAFSAMLGTAIWIPILLAFTTIAPWIAVVCVGVTCLALWLGCIGVTKWYVQYLRRRCVSSSSS
jgi:hypothetical protein